MNAVGSSSVKQRAGHSIVATTRLTPSIPSRRLIFDCRISSAELNSGTFICVPILLLHYGPPLKYGKAGLYTTAYMMIACEVSPPSPSAANDALKQRLDAITLSDNPHSSVF